MGKEITVLECAHREGLPGAPKHYCKLYEGADSLKLEVPEQKGWFKKIPTAPYTIPAERLISIDLVTSWDVEEKSKSVVGRGIAGAVIFGSVGAIIGGLSGTGSKKNEQMREFVNIAYYNKEEEIKIIVLEVLFMKEKERRFVDGLRKKYITDKLERNTAGEILL